MTDEQYAVMIAAFDLQTDLLQRLLTAVTTPAPQSSLERFIRDLAMTNRQIMNALASIIQNIKEVKVQIGLIRRNDNGDNAGAGP